MLLRLTTRMTKRSTMTSKPRFPKAVLQIQRSVTQALKQFNASSDADQLKRAEDLLSDAILVDPEA